MNASVEFETRLPSKRHKGVLGFTKSAYIWFLTGMLVILWFPFVALTRLFDRDPRRMRTSECVRRMNVAISKANLLLDAEINLDHMPKAGGPFIVVVNHQSMADIPLVSNLPLTAKWVAKKAAFRCPFIGWIMILAGDIPVDFKADNRKSQTLNKANQYLHQGISVIFFPEGKRTLTGKLGRFSRGAFELAVATGTPILPVVIDGLWTFLPVSSWRFGSPEMSRMKVLDPIPTKGLSMKDAGYIREKIRFQMLQTLSDWHGLDPDDLDGILDVDPDRIQQQDDSCPLFI